MSSRTRFKDISSGLASILGRVPTRAESSAAQEMLESLSLSSDTSTGAEQINSFLLETKQVYNAYKRESREDYRVKQWPNNQWIKVNQRRNYIDIERDFPFFSNIELVDHGTPVSSFGSCFAERVAEFLVGLRCNYQAHEQLDFEYLRQMGCRYPDWDYLISKSKLSPARVGNLFNTEDILFCLKYGLGQIEYPRLLIQKKDALVDPFRNVKPIFSDENSFARDVEHHSMCLGNAIKSSQVVVLTPGLCEGFKHRQTGINISCNPDLFSPWELIPFVHSTSDAVQYLGIAVELLTKANPNVSIILSLSPVPLNKTLQSGKHVVQATQEAKAKLRVAIQEIVDQFDNVYYLPAYELVNYGISRPWETDRRHVSDAAVNRIVECFVNQFGTAGFRQAFYADYSSALSESSLVSAKPQIFSQIKDLVQQILHR